MSPATLEDHRCIRITGRLTNDFEMDRRRPDRWSRWRGLTLIEMGVVILLIATLLTVVIIPIQKARHSGKVTAAIGEITSLGFDITMFRERWNRLPSSLSELEKEETLDPWGRTYQYLNIADAGRRVIGNARKDHFLVPLNTDYDLYSQGEDGKSRSPLSASASQDDIVRANNGAYVGLASDF